MLWLNYVYYLYCFYSIITLSQPLALCVLEPVVAVTVRDAVGFLLGILRIRARVQGSVLTTTQMCICDES